MLFLVPQTSALTGLRYAPTEFALPDQSSRVNRQCVAPSETRTKGNHCDLSGPLNPEKVPSARGYSAIGLVRPKDVRNVGAVLRAAHCYGAALVAVQGGRTPLRSSQDTTKAFRHIPVIRGDDLSEIVPYGATPVAVDLVDGAIPLPALRHPASAFYVFGPEDGTLGAATLAWCPLRVMVPTRFCMNLAATVNVVLYDRLAKLTPPLCGRA